MLTSELSQSSARMKVRSSAVTSSGDSLTSDVPEVFGGYSSFKLLHLLTAAAATGTGIVAAAATATT
jgi:hypothetical protein